FRGSIQPWQCCYRGGFLTRLRRLVGDSANEFFKYRLGNRVSGEIRPVAHNGDTEAGLGMPAHMRTETRVAAGVVEEFSEFIIPPVVQTEAIPFVARRVGICWSFVEYPWILYRLQHSLSTRQ